MHDYTEPRVGTVGFDGPPGRTFAKLSLLEYGESFRGNPSVKSLRGLRKKAGGDFCFVLRTSAALTHGGQPDVKRLKLGYLPDERLPDAPFDTGELGQAAWRWTLEVAETLGAEGVFCQTPASFRPTPANRARLSAFVEQVRGDHRLPFFWDSQGLWERHEQVALCADLGLTVCYDPLLEDVPLPGRAYLRVLGKARSSHGLGADELYRLADAVEATEAPRVALHTPQPFRDARSLLTALTGG